MKKSNVLFYISILVTIAPLAIFAVAPEKSVNSVLMIDALTRHGLLLIGIILASVTILYLTFRRIYSEDDNVSRIRLSIFDRIIHFLSLGIAAISLIALLSYAEMLAISSSTGTGLILTILIVYISGFLYESLYYARTKKKNTTEIFNQAAATVTPLLIGMYCMLITSLIGLSYVAPDTMALARVAATLILWQIFYCLFTRTYLTRKLAAP